jgi:hypothetical protein
MPEIQVKVTGADRIRSTFGPHSVSGFSEDLGSNAPGAIFQRGVSSAMWTGCGPNPGASAPMVSRTREGWHDQSVSAPDSLTGSSTTTFSRLQCRIRASPHPGGTLESVFHKSTRICRSCRRSNQLDQEDCRTVPGSKTVETWSPRTGTQQWGREQKPAPHKTRAPRPDWRHRTSSPRLLGPSPSKSLKRIQTRMRD